MEIKKSSKASLEKKRGLYVQIGLVVTIAMVLVAFEWTSRPQDNQLFAMSESGEAEEDIIPVTRQLLEQPPPPPPPPQVIEVINIVEDDVDIEEIDFESMDADEDMEIDFVPIEEEEAEEEVFFIVEDMPMFNGQEASLGFRTYIAQNLQYPTIASENGISGRVFVQFAVNTNGEVCDVQVVRGVDPALDKEAVRVVKSSPRWTPGKQRGRPVKVQFTFPIVFVLQ